jgi:hypothetical protein
MQIQFTPAKIHNAGLLCMEHEDSVEIMPNEGGKFITIPMDANKMMELNEANPMHASIIAAIVASET